MIEELLQRCCSYISIKDPRVKQLIGDFFRSYYNSGHSFLRDRRLPTDSYTTYNFSVRNLSHVFVDTKYDALNSRTCLMLCEKAWKYARLYSLFWVYYCRHESNCDPLLLRLIDFENVFYNRNIPLSYLKIIILDKSYDKFLASSLYGHMQEIIPFSIYFFDPELDFIVDTNIYDCLNTYFEENMYSNEYTLSTLRNWQIRNKKVAHALFKNKSIDTMTRKTIYNVLFEVITDLAQGNDYQRALVEIFYYLYKSGISLPDNIDIFAIKLHEKGCVRITDCQNLLQADDLDKWYFIHENRFNGDRIGRMFYINYPDKDIRDMFADFLDEYGHNERALVDIGNLFENSMLPHRPMNVLDLNFRTYISQIHYFFERGFTEKIYSQFITSFYLYVWRNCNYTLFEEDYIDIHVLLRANIGQLLLEGVVIINYTPAEPVPESDKWILCYSKFLQSNSMVNNGLFNLHIDFSNIECALYRSYAKKWLWGYKSELICKIGQLRQITDALNYIFQLKKGKELSFFTKPSKNLNININDIVAWKSWVLAKITNNRTRGHYIYALRNFITYLNDNYICSFESGVFFHLTHTLNQNYDNSKAIPNNELSKLASVLKDEAANNILGQLCYSAFYIALETEFRPTQIFSLKRDCIRETAKKNEYVLISRSKTSSGEDWEFPITEYVKREIEEIIKQTETYRESTSILDLKDYLFLVPRHKKGHFMLLTCGAFNVHLHNCCQIANIPKYSVSNLRDTHMTKAEEEIIRKSLSEVQMSVLTGHKNPNSDRTYIDTNIRTMLESVHGIIIGDVTADGQIMSIKTAEMVPENEVSHSCGYCTNHSCNNFTYLDCMLCKYFVTTPDRLPFFYEQLKQLDLQIPVAKSPHDREDLINIKRLILFYSEKIMSMKGDFSNET